jgi:hypothetical protein
MPTNRILPDRALIQNLRRAHSRLSGIEARHPRRNSDRWYARRQRIAGCMTRGRANLRITVIGAIARTVLQQHDKLSHEADVATN